MSSYFICIYAWIFKWVCPLGFPIKRLYAILFCSKLAICHAHSMLLELNIMQQFGITEYVHNIVAWRVYNIKSVNAQQAPVTDDNFENIKEKF
jgi:hypothetical protein